MRVLCRCVRQAGSTIGSKTWTTLDSLELVDQPAALVPLEALPQQSEKALTGTASALEDDSKPTAPGVLCHSSLNLLMPARTQDTWLSDCHAIHWMPHVALSLRSLPLDLCGRGLEMPSQVAVHSRCALWPEPAAARQTTGKASGCRCSQPLALQRRCRSGLLGTHQCSGCA